MIIAAVLTLVLILPIAISVNANTADTSFYFKFNSYITSPHTEFRRKDTSSSIYIHPTSFSDPSKTIWVGAQVLASDIFNVSSMRGEIYAGQKFELYNNAYESYGGYGPISVRIVAQNNPRNGLIVSGVWSPDYAPEPNVVVIR